MGSICWITDQRHADHWQGKDDVADSSDEEDDAFSYNLSQEEVDRVRGQKYGRQLKGLYATATPSAVPQHHNVDIPLEEWMRIFMAFQAEHVRSFPKDAPSMPGYVDLITKMKVGGILWLLYDTLLRQKRAKKIDRGSRRVKYWAVTDIVLYLACQPPRAVAKVGGNKLARPSPRLPTSQYQPQQPQLTQQAQPSPQQPPSQGGILMQSRMCWCFQSARGCNGSCLWLHTHQCYTCGADHCTEVCTSGSAHPDSAIPEQQQQQPFLPQEGKVVERAAGALDRDYRPVPSPGAEGDRAATLKKEWPNPHH